MKNQIVFELGHKPKFFLPELLARIILTTFICITYTSFYQRKNLVIECLTFCIIINSLISFISLYYAYRRVQGIKHTIKLRLSTHREFKESNIAFVSNFRNSDFRYLVALQAFIFGVAIVLEPFILGNQQDDNMYMLPVALAAILTPVVYIIVFLFFRGFFLNHNIISISKNGEKLSDEEVASVRDFFKDNPIESTHYMNDMWLIAYRRKLSEYRQRVDTLLIEAVFIGTLTFATFVQLTSPESISSLPLIQKKEDSYHRVNHINDSILSKQEFMAMVRFYASKNGGIDDGILQLINNNFPSCGKINLEPRRSTVGYFRDWVINRKLTIFKSYYLQRNDNGWIFQHITDNGVPGGLANVTAKDFHKFINFEWYKDSNKFSEAYYKKYSNGLIYWSLAKRLEEKEIEHIHGKDFNEIEKLTARYSTVGWGRFKSITKKTWDEQEYLFLIAIGSILCSVCFIAVLLKRFPLIIGIERFSSEINKASVWNNREEQIQVKRMEYDIESRLSNSNSNQVVIDEYEERQNWYTEQMQLQLSICELQANRLDTNIKTISILRTFGLFIFYFILSISTLMIDYVAAVFLFVLLTYSIFGAQIMNDESIFYAVFSRVFKRKKPDDTIFAN